MSNEDIVKLIQAGTDVQYNSERLYIQNTGFIYGIAKKYAAYEDIDDLMQEAYFGLMAAVRGYRPGEASFLVYASYWIKQAVMRYVHGNGAVSMGEKTAADLMRYKKLYDEYVSCNGEKPPQEHTARQMGISVERVKELELYAYRCSVSSIDKVCSEDENSTIGYLLTGSEGREDDTVDKVFRQHVYTELWQRVGELEQKQAQAIKERYQNDRTQEAAAAIIGVSREQLRQLQNKAMRRLRESCRGGIIGQYADEYIYSAGIKNYNFRTSWTSSTEHVALKRLEHH